MENTEYNLTELAVTAANSILSSLGFDFELSTASAEDGVCVMITSPDARFLIGEEGIAHPLLEILGIHYTIKTGTKIINLC